MKEMSLWDLRAVDNSKVFLQTRKECPFISNVWNYFKEEYLKLWVNVSLVIKKKKPHTQTKPSVELGIFSLLWSLRTQRQRNTHSDVSVGIDDAQTYPARDKYRLVRLQHTAT